MALLHGKLDGGKINEGFGTCAVEHEKVGVCNGERFREQEALAVLALQQPKLLQLLLSLDTFSNNLHTEIACERNNRFHDLKVFISRIHTRNKRAIDLQSIDGKTIEITQRGISGAEIVDAQANAETAKFRERDRSELR